MAAYRRLEVEREGPVARVFLNRPEIHNAFDDVMLREIRDAFAALGADGNVRVVVLGGRGKSFCAGADLNWMRRMVHYSREENLRDAALLQEMLTTVNECPKPVLARVHGAALGGGTGLAAVCDIVVASPRAVFGATEVRLGLLPAVISPFLLAKIGPGHARDVFLSGERFDAERAARIGLAHYVVSPEELDPFLERKIDQLLQNGPQALARAKELIRQVAWRPAEEVAPLTLEAIAHARVSPEGQEGMAAFLERRPPRYRVERKP